MVLRGGLFHALLTSHDSESNQPGKSTRIACFFQGASEPLDPACEPLDQACRCNQPGRSTRITCFFQALVSRWIRLVSRWIRLVVAGSHPPIRKKHTDRVFLSSACESFDHACEPLDQASRLKPSMVQFVHEVHPVFLIALSTVM